jgi:prepilin-type N-terminal cleavage/methylation domain-containing protein
MMTTSHVSDQSQRPARRRSQRGVTLIELLAAMTISVVISSLILVSWFSLTGSYANTTKRGKAGDWARVTTARMVREIRDVEQPPPTVGEVGIVRARPYYIVLYTTFNEAGNASAATPPRLVMYRLYSNGQLWRFHDADNNGSIGGVNITAESWPGITFPLGERTAGEGGQLMVSNVVNTANPSVASPTAMFTYASYGADGAFDTAVDIRGTTERAQIRAVEMNMLLDLNPGRSPVYTHLRSTAQLRNTR